MRQFIVFLYCTVFMCNVSAQKSVFHQITYRGVVRRGNTPVINATINIQLTVLKSSSRGVTVYQETQLALTNFFGAFDITIGAGKVSKGNFENINWAEGTYYLKATIDTTGGNHFTTDESVHMLHPPFAIYAKSAGSNTNGETGINGFKHYIGEICNGGIVFNFWKDESGVEHGLVVALTDQSDSVEWSNMDTVSIGHTAENFYDGLSNTEAMIRQHGQNNSAAQICRKYTGGGYHDWYLPSIEELNMLYDSRLKIKKVLKTSGRQIGNNIYWSSTEAFATTAWAFAAYGGASNNYVFSKYGKAYVRAIRYF